MVHNKLTLCCAEFRKASRSTGNNACVEQARKHGKVFLRDTKVEFGSVDDKIIVLAEQEFDAFQADVRAGDITTARGLYVVVRGDGMYVFRHRAEHTDGTELVFDQEELDAFVDGVRKGEFDDEGTHVAHTAACAHRDVAVSAA